MSLTTTQPVDLLNAVIDQLPTGVIILDATTRQVLVANQAAYDILQLPPSDDFFGQLKGFRPDGRPYQQDEWPVFRAVASGQSVTGEEIHVSRADQSTVVVLISAVPIRQADGQIKHVVATIVDLSDHQRTNKHQHFLNQAGELLAKSLDWQTTLDQIARLAVPQVADWFAIDLIEEGQCQRVAVAHVDPEKVKWAHEITAKYPMDLDAPTGPAQVMRTGLAEFYPQITDEMLVAAAQDEEQLQVLRQVGYHSVIIVPLTARDRTFGAIWFVNTQESRRTYDRTDLRLAQKLALRCALAIDNARLYRQAQEAIGIQQTMLAVVSHDLKNPLNILVMLVDFLKQKVDPSLEGYLERMSRACERMLHLIRDLLDVAALESGKLSVTPQDLEVSALIEEAIEMHRPLAEQKKQWLTADLPAGLRVWGDRHRLQQVLANLIGNALKFTSEFGQIQVEARATDDSVEILVSDSGPGIDPAQQPLLFLPYWRGGQKSAGGTGLGLYIAKGIVEAHRGRIWVKSVPGSGSTFGITLPKSAP